MYRRIIFFVLPLIIFAALPAGAAMISVKVIETGFPGDGPANRYSVLWENGLMDVYFDLGHIVSNSPILRLPQGIADGFPYEIERDYDEARETGMKYFIVAIVSHPSPYKVSLRFFSTKSTEMIYELRYTDNPSLLENDRVKKIKKAIQETAAQLK